MGLLSHWHTPYPNVFLIAYHRPIASSTHITHLSYATQSHMQMPAAPLPLRYHHTSLHLQHVLLLLLTDTPDPVARHNFAPQLHKYIKTVKIQHSLDMVQDQGIEVYLAQFSDIANRYKEYPVPTASPSLTGDANEVYVEAPDGERFMIVVRLGSISTRKAARYSG